MASLMLIHDLYPVPLEERVQEGLDSVRPVHGVPRRQRRAAGDRGRDREAAARGLVQRLRGVGVDAGARGRAGAAGDGAGPRGDRRRGRRGAAGAGARGVRAADGRRRRAGERLAGAGRLRAAAARARDDRVVAADRQRGRRPARLPQPLRRLQQRARPRRPQRRHADLPDLPRGFDLPRAGRSDERAAAQPRAAAARRRHACGSRWHDGDPAGPGDAASAGSARRSRRRR